ncbi:MAG: hypothetical protein ACRCY0_07150 [Synechococcus elongatus]
MRRSPSLNVEYGAMTPLLRAALLPRFSARLELVLFGDRPIHE